MRKLLVASLLLLGLSSVEARIRIDGTTCLSVDSDRIYHDTNCDGVKDAGENYVDQTGGGGSGSLNVEDGGVSIVTTSTMNFTGAQFIITDDSGEALVAVDGSSVTLLGATIEESEITDLVHTTDTGPIPDCSGTTTYQDGEGNCDDLSSVYAPIAGSIEVQDGGSSIVTTSTMNFTGAQFIVTDNGGEALIAVDGSSVTLLGPTIEESEITDLVHDGSGYDVEPATVTFLLDEGMTATTGTFTTSVSIGTTTHGVPLHISVAQGNTLIRVDAPGTGFTTTTPLTDIYAGDFANALGKRGSLAFAHYANGLRAFDFRNDADSVVFRVGLDETFGRYMAMLSTSTQRFYDSDNTNYVGFRSSNVVSADQVWILPDADGTANQLLSTDGGGVLSWKTDSLGGGGATISVEDGGSEIVQTSTMDFTGAQFIITDNGGDALIALDPSSVTLQGVIDLNNLGGITGIEVEDGGSSIVNTSTMDFTGAQFVVTDSGGKALIAVDGSSVTLLGPTIEESEISDLQHDGTGYDLEPATVTIQGDEGITATTMTVTSTFTVTLGTVVINGTTMYFPSPTGSESAGQVLEIASVSGGALTLEWDTDNAGAGGSTIDVQDGGSQIVNTSTMDFTGAQFIVTDNGGEALIAVDGSSVTLLGPTIEESEISDLTHTTPASPNQSIQYNNGGSFGGTADLTYSDVSGAGLIISSRTTEGPFLRFTQSNVSWTDTGNIEWYVGPDGSETLQSRFGYGNSEFRFTDSSGDPTFEVRNAATNQPAIAYHGLATDGSFGYEPDSVTADKSINIDSHFWRADATAGPIVITLPDIDKLSTPQITRVSYRFIKTDSSTHTITFVKGAAEDTDLTEQSTLYELGEWVLLVASHTTGTDNGFWYVGGHGFNNDIRLTGSSDLKFADDNEDNYVSFKASAALTSNYNYVLPDSSGTANQVLSTDGNGILSWKTDSLGGGGATISVEDGGSEIVQTSTMDFTGAEFVITNVGGEANIKLDASSVTLQGNTFNGPNQLVKTDGSTIIPNTVEASSISVNTVGSPQIIDNSITFADPDHTITLAGDPALASGQVYAGTSGLIFEGSTDNTIEALLTTVDPTTTDKTWTLPNVTGGIPVVSANGLVTRTAANTYASRTITNTDGLIDITNGGGVSGNPVVAISSEVVKTTGTTLSNGDIIYRTGGRWLNLGIGGDGEVLKVASSLPSWGTDETSAGGGDNLGNHIATQTLNMAGFPISNVSSMTMTGNQAPVISSTWTTLAVQVTDTADYDFVIGETSTTVERLSITGTTCLSVTSDQIYHDTNCDGVKDGGEEFIDQASGAGGGYDHEPATVTFQLDAGVTASTLTVTSTSTLSYTVINSSAVISTAIVSGYMSVDQGISIGIANPTVDLHIEKSAAVEILLKSEGGDAKVSIDRPNATTGATVEIKNSGIAKWGFGLPVAATRFGIFEDNNPSLARFIIETGGQVGIGTTISDGLLHLDNGTSDTDLLIEKDDATEARIVYHNGGSEVADISFDANEDIIVTNTLGDTIITNDLISQSTFTVTLATTVLNGTTYYWPFQNDGTSGQVLHTDGSGVLTWDTDDTGGAGSFLLEVHDDGTEVDTAVSTINFTSALISTQNAAGDVSVYVGLESTQFSVVSDSITIITDGIGIDELDRTANYTWTGVHDYSTGVLELPNSASPTVDATGEIAVDTTDKQLIWFDGDNAVVVSSTFSKSMTIETPGVGDFPFFWRTHEDITVTALVCISSAATSATIEVQECNADGASCVTINTAEACTTTNQVATLTDTAIDAGDRIRVKVTAVSGTPGWTAIDMYYRETRN